MKQNILWSLAFSVWRLVFARPARTATHLIGNHASSDTQLDATACANAAPIEAGDWVQLAPYGRFQVGITNKKSTARSAQQVFSREHATAIVTEFNSAMGQLGRLFRGAGVYAGHPDLDPVRWPDERRLGKIMELEARADGLYGKPAWNSRGTENLQEGFLVYPSIVWRCEQKGNELHPFALKSVGLTNEPNIPGVSPVTANAADLSEENQTTTTANTMPPWLIELLGLPADATEEQIKTALNGKLTAANAQPIIVKTGELEILVANADAEKAVVKLAADLTAANTASTAAATALQESRTAHAEILIANALKEGRITGADRDTLVAAFAADFTKATTDLAARKPIVNTERLHVGNRKPEHVEDLQRQKRLVDTVHARMDSHKEDYTTAYGNVKKDPAHKDLFATPKQQEAAV